MKSKSPHHHWMSLALEEAASAAAEGEVPVGAVVVKDGKLITRAHNRVEQLQDATAHAERLAVQEAGNALGNWRLEGASLYVTLEPCSMCIGALILSRIDALYFGAYDPRQGAVGSLFNLAEHPELPHSIEVYPELMRDKSEILLKTFFEQRRTAKRS